MHTCRSSLLLIPALVIVLTCAVASAQPLNNNCASPLLVQQGTVFFSTGGATTDGPPDVACSFFGDNQVHSDIWFRYLPSCGGTVVVSLCNPAANFDTKLAVYASFYCPNPDTALVCNDDSCGLQSQVSLFVSPGVPYLIRVGGYLSATGSGALNIWQPAAPSNDVCYVVPQVYDGVTPFDTTCATGAGPAEAMCGPVPLDIGNDIWYVYVASHTGDTRFSLCGSTFDTMIGIYPYVYNECPTSPGAILACNDDYCGLQSQLHFFTQAGVIYRIRLGGYEGATGPGTLTIGNVPPPNDACVNAIDITQSGFSSGQLSVASNDGTASCGASALNPDVWYSFTSPSTGQLLATTCGSNDPRGQVDEGIDSVLSVYTTCPGAGSIELACNDDLAICAEFIDRGLRRDSGVYVNLFSGETVLIRVSSFGDSPVGVDGLLYLHAYFTAGPGPVDWDGNGSVGSQDFFNFITDFFAGRADFNRDARTTSQDFFDFIVAFFAG